jgi:hypothetical protein
MKKKSHAAASWRRDVGAQNGAAGARFLSFAVVQAGRVIGN